MGATYWSMGDRLIHAAKPEWGIGEVRSSESVVQDGNPCQRLTIRFDRAGVKVLSTAFADLRAPDGFIAPPEPALDDALPADAVNAAMRLRLVELPESATDPFKPRRSRLEFTLGLYRFTNAGGSLLDWASAQTVLKDPLSRFSRHELEQDFEKFRFNLDAHVRQLLFELKREDPSSVQQLTATVSPAIKQVLRRIDAMR